MLGLFEVSSRNFARIKIVFNRKRLGEMETIFAEAAQPTVPGMVSQHQDNSEAKTNTAKSYKTALSEEVKSCSPCEPRSNKFHEQRNRKR